MKSFPIIAVSLMSLAYAADNPLAQKAIPNPQISYPIFLKNAQDVGSIRETRRVSEDEFLNMMKDPAVVVLDARSSDKYQLRHIQGSVNLSLPDFSEAALARIIPRKDTKVLIYCNNNFINNIASLVSKSVGASLNVHTFVTLHTYGYTNIYELAPLLDVNTTRLPFAGKELRQE